MKIKLLFVNPAPYEGRKYNIPNFGLIYLISYYKKFGKYPRQVQFKIYDENCQDEEDLAAILRDYDPNIVGFSCTSLVVERAEELIKIVRLKKKKALIIGGGVHFQIDPLGSIKKLDVDLAFTGEGEIPFRDFLDLYLEKKGRLNNKLLSQLKGIGYKTNLGFIVNPPGEITRDLDFISYRDFAYYDEEYYFQKKYELYPGKHGRVLTLLSSRGCPFSCKFCFNSFQKKPLRFHSAGHTLKLVRHFVKKYDIKLVNINDDLFMADKERVAEFCRRLLAARVEIQWVCQGRPDILSEEDTALLELMKKAGCEQICFGFESGSNRILKFIKGETSSVEKNQRAIDLVHQSGIRVFGYFMLGIPRETKKDLLMTKLFIEKNLNSLSFYEVFVFTPLPGTFLWDWCEKEGLLKKVIFADLVTNMFSMEYKSFKIFTKGLKKKDVYSIKEHLKQLIIKREPLKNKVSYFLLNIFRDPEMTLSKLFYYFGIKTQ